MPVRARLGNIILSCVFFEGFAFAWNKSMEEKALMDRIYELSKRGICVIRIPRISNYTSEEDIEYTVQYIRGMGFARIDRFDYKIDVESINDM